MCILSRRLLSMSLPASLTTDCGELLNHRGPVRKRCCHTEALHAGYHVYSSHGWSRRSRSFHTRFLFVPNYRICELVYFHTEHRGESRSYCPEFANCRLFFTRRIADVTAFLSLDLSFGPTDQREVICELSNFFFTRNVADGRGGYEGGTIEA